MNEISTWNFYLVGKLCFVSEVVDITGDEIFKQKQNYFPANVIHSLISKFKYSFCRILPKGRDVVESLFRVGFQASLNNKFDENDLDRNSQRVSNEQLDAVSDDSFLTLN